MITANVGIGALPVHIAQKDVEQGLLWQVPPYDGLPVVDLHVVTNPNSNLNPAEATYLAMLHDMLDSVPLSERTYTGRM